MHSTARVSARLSYRKIFRNLCNLETFYQTISPVNLIPQNYSKLPLRSFAVQNKDIVCYSLYLPKFSPGHGTEKNKSVLSIEKLAYFYFVVCKFARMLHLKMASFKHHLFYKKHQYPGILLLHGNRLNHTAAYPSQSICANKNLAQFNAIYDYISFYMQTSHKIFSKITSGP